MAEHDERESTPPYPRRTGDDVSRDFYPDELRPATKREVREVADGLHRTSNRVHEQQASIAVLKQRVDDHHAVINGLPERFREVERDAETRERHAKDHADEIVSALEKRLSDAATRWIAIAAIVSGLVGGLVPVLVSLLTRGKP